MGPRERALRRETLLVQGHVRPVCSDDLEALRVIERQAGERFREVGLVEVADDKPLSIEELSRYADAGRAWVAIDKAGQAVGYILVDEIDGLCHIEQISVRPDAQGKGVARHLIRAAIGASYRKGLPASATLTTFDRVIWNRPLFEHLGFRVLRDAEIGDGLRALREVEAERGLDPALRVAMRADFTISG